MAHESDVETLIAEEIKRTTFNHGAAVFFAVEEQLLREGIGEDLSDAVVHHTARLANIVGGEKEDQGNPPNPRMQFNFSYDNRHDMLDAWTRGQNVSVESTTRLGTSVSLTGLNLHSGLNLPEGSTTETHLVAVVDTKGRVHGLSKSLGELLVGEDATDVEIIFGEEENSVAAFDDFLVNADRGAKTRFTIKYRARDRDLKVPTEMLKEFDIKFVSRGSEQLAVFSLEEAAKPPIDEPMVLSNSAIAVLRKVFSSGDIDRSILEGVTRSDVEDFFLAINALENPNFPTFDNTRPTYSVLEGTDEMPGRTRIEINASWFNRSLYGDYTSYIFVDRDFPRSKPPEVSKKQYYTTPYAEVVVDISPTSMPLSMRFLPEADNEEDQVLQETACNEKGYISTKTNVVMPDGTRLMTYVQTTYPELEDVMEAAFLEHDVETLRLFTQSSGGRDPLIVRAFDEPKVQKGMRRLAKVFDSNAADLTNPQLLTKKNNDNGEFIVPAKPHHALTESLAFSYAASHNFLVFRATKGVIFMEAMHLKLDKTQLAMNETWRGATVTEINAEYYGSLGAYGSTFILMQEQEVSKLNSESFMAYVTGLRRHTYPSDVEPLMAFLAQQEGEGKFGEDDEFVLRPTEGSGVTYRFIRHTYPQTIKSLVDSEEESMLDDKYVVFQIVKEED